jgi:hypothetical protein
MLDRSESVAISARSVIVLLCRHFRQFSVLLAFVHLPNEVAGPVANLLAWPIPQVVEQS